VPDALIIDCAQQTECSAPLSGDALAAYEKQQALSAAQSAAQDAAQAQRERDIATLRRAAQHGGASGHDGDLWAALVRLLGLL
jgi:hypothetical protein